MRWCGWHATDDVPIIEAVRTGYGYRRIRAGEFLCNESEPLARRATVGIDVNEYVAGRDPASVLTRDDEPLPRLVHDPYTGDGRSRRCAVGARIVDDDDFVRWE